MGAKKATKKTTNKAVETAAMNGDKNNSLQPIEAANARLKVAGSGWTYTPVTEPVTAAANGTGDSGRRHTYRGFDTKPDIIDEIILKEGFEKLEEGEVRASSGRRSMNETLASELQVIAEVSRDEPVLLVIRQQPSEAISFRRPVSHRTDGVTGQGQVIFNVPLAKGESDLGRRGIASKIVKVVLLKLSDAVAGRLLKQAGELVVPLLATELEKRLWNDKTLGWIRVTEAALASNEDTMSAGLPGFRAPERGLLFLHGTFSSCHGGFRALVDTPFFSGIRARYGDNLFAFNHFTISKTPEENVKDLLDALPPGNEFEFDVITHSRGGLVIRELLEGSGVTHPNFSRLKMGRVVLVASPSAGTPLASPAHWEDKLSFWANLLEMLPDNPFSTGAAWLAESLQWLAANVLGNCKGLTAMDPGGEYIDNINGDPSAPVHVPYYALVSNFHPPKEFLARLGDLAVDQFFGGANDLVVPSTGAWRGSHNPAEWISGDRLGCFGPGGNLISTQVVHHCNYFQNPVTVEFLLNALRGQEFTYPRLDPGVELPIRSIRITRGTQRSTEAEPGSKIDASTSSGEEANMTAQPLRSTVSKAGFDAEEVLWLTVISSVESVTVADQKEIPLLLATYGSARVVVPFYIKGKKDDAGKKWGEIFHRQRFLVGYANGQNVSLKLEGKPIDYPTADFLKDFGDKLFQKLFPEEVRNLYNISRFKHEKRRLKIVFTSMIPWVADIPWELAYDKKSDCFLSCADVRFIRNVLTPTPANTIRSKSGPLRILVVSAQPAGMGTLSIEEEQKGIRDSFRPLVDAGLVTVEVIAGATASRLHECLRHPASGEFDVLHFIGHGVYEEETKTGYLFFEDEIGRARKLSATQFLDIVRGRNIRMVFLNACETGRGDRADYNRGVAMSLARDGMPAVVANQYSVIDRSASLFSLHFYCSLAQGLNIGDAMREARVAIQYCGVEPMDWGVPVLFTSYPDAHLCTPLSKTTESTNETTLDTIILSRPSSSSRRLSGDARQMVIIWNAEGSMARSHEFDTIAHELNGAQNSFYFQMEYFTPPRNLWAPDLDNAYDGHAYLRVEKVIGRMNRIRERLQADIMFCVTKMPLQGDDTLNVYYHPEKQVSVFSNWSFDPPIDGLLFKRGLANHLGISLLFNLAGDDLEEPENPQLHDLDYFNAERSVEHITDRMNLESVEDQIGQDDKIGNLTRSKFNAIKSIMMLYQNSSSAASDKDA